MKYPYIVVHNGKWYNAGEEVPENNNSGASFDYSKTTINRMSTSDLQAFATEQGIDNTEEQMYTIADQLHRIIKHNTEGMEP